MSRCLMAWFMLLVSTAAAADRGFTMTDMAGNRHQLEDYRGKWVLVNYWASWCPPCLEEIPDLVALYDERKDKNLMVLGVALEYGNAQEVVDYVDDMLMSYPVVLGDSTVTAQIGPADVLPTSYIYDPAGNLVVAKRGVVTKEYVEKLISQR